MVDNLAELRTMSFATNQEPARKQYLSTRASMYLSIKTSPEFEKNLQGRAQERAAMGGDNFLHRLNNGMSKLSEIVKKIDPLAEI